MIASRSEVGSVRDGTDRHVVAAARARLPQISGTLVVTFVAAGLVLGWLAPSALGSTGTGQRYWLVLPGVVAAMRFGFAGATITSIAATIVGGPLVGVLPNQHMQSASAWLAALFFFQTVTSVVAAIARRMKEADARLVALLDQQREHALSAAEERGHLTRELERRVNQDVLTGLANRSAFVEHLQQRIGAGAPLAVLFVDLDDFKTVNDTLGHAIGDELLAGVASRLIEGSRGHDIVARFGGDEFAIMLANVGGADALRVGQRVLGQLKTPFNLCGRTVAVRASGGIALYDGSPSGGDDRRALELMRQADLAMYASKSARTHGITLFHDDMQSEMVARLALESDLHQALAHHDFHLEFQPIVDLGSDKLSAVEALLRWTHPTRGSISPVSFIPVAEQTGMIVPLTLWVVREACAQLQAWDRNELTKGMTMAINISGRFVVEPGIGSAMARELYHAGIDPHRVILEITESLLMEDRTQAVQTLCQLRALGMRLSVDDFGTGYSSLSRLNTLPIDEVKIDRSFIAQLNRGEAGETIVRASIAMAHGLGLRVVAEGVETERQLQVLRAAGCDDAQGYLFGRPLPAADLERFLRDREATDDVVRALPRQESTRQATAGDEWQESLRTG